MAQGAQIRFSDGAGYEAMMGVWSRLVGQQFLDWLNPANNQKWLDVGCGNGAFTRIIAEHCSPSHVIGLDPSEAQLAYARDQQPGPGVEFISGSAMDLPFEDGTFDHASSALVIFFMPDPARGVREMARVTRPGGTVSTYAWDLDGGGFPYEINQAEMSALGFEPLNAPHPKAASLSELGRMWEAAGLRNSVIRSFAVERDYPSFEEFWKVAEITPGLRPVLATMSHSEQARLTDRVRRRLEGEPGGPVRVTAVANSVKGAVPL